MLAWVDFDLQSLFPDEFIDVIDSITSAVATIVGVLNTVIGIVSQLVQFVLDFVDPLQALLDALIQEIENLINDIINANVFILYQKLPNQLGLFGYKTDEAGGVVDATRGRSAAATVEEIVESLFDEGDANRPQFSTSAQIGGVIMMVGAPSFSQFSTLVTAFNKVFNVKDWDEWLERQQRRFEVSSNVPGVITGISTQDGVPPTGTLIDGRQDVADVPQNAFIRMLNGSSRGQLYRIINATSGGAETLPESSRVPGNDGVTFTVDPIPFGVQANQRNFDQILANLKADVGFEQPIGQPEENLVTLVDDPFFLFTSIRAGIIDSDGTISGDRYSVETGTFDSTDPDWFQLPLSQAFAALTPLFDKMDQLVDFLGFAKQATVAIQELIDAIQLKIDALNDLITDFQQIINDITDALGATGFHILFIPPQTGGIDQLVYNIRTADNLPPFGPGDYTAAVTILAAGPSLDALLGLFS